MPSNNHRMQGFTLMELSIVLVIIGFLVGGLLVGQEMIHGAQVRSVINDVTRIKIAYTAFEDKYSCIPGDCPNATDWGFGVNGNGDKIVVGTSEQWEFMQQLIQAQLLAEDGRDYLMTKMNNCDMIINGSYPIYEDTWNKFNVILLRFFLSANPWHGPCVSPSDARSIDAKLDDGIASKGNVRGWVWPGTPFVDCLTADSNTGGAPGNAEYVENSKPACIMHMRLD